MAGPVKIDIEILGRMIGDGKNLAEIAAHFGVSVAAVSKRVKKLGMAVKKHVAKSIVTERAPMVVTQRLNSIEQLQKINNDANELLDLCMAWQRGDDVALRILEGQVNKIIVGKGEDATEVQQYKFKDPRELALKAMAEIRNQLRLQLDIFKTLYDAEAVKEFQHELIEMLGEINPELRDQFIQRLREKGVVRSILEFSGPTIR